MTLDQLRIFVAVAEREHLTQAAAAVSLTPSAVSAAVQNLEQRYDVRLFHRVGRRIELSRDGRTFLAEARAALAGARDAERALLELGQLSRGTLAIAASQTLASYWLPPALMRYAQTHPGISLKVEEGNTETVAAAVMDGRCDLGFIEGEIDAPALNVTVVDTDLLMIVAPTDHPLARARKVMAAQLATARWVLREAGSGTRSVFEEAMADAGIDPASLDVILRLPTNEAVCAAVRGSDCLTVVSELVARRHLEAGHLSRVPYALPLRNFAMLRHKERYRGRPALAFEDILRQFIEKRGRSSPRKAARPR